MNPLLHTFNTPYTTAPFDAIENHHYLPAFTLAIAEAKAEIDEMVNNSEVPTFKNVIEALEFAGGQLDRISSIFFNLNSAETSKELQKIAQEVSPMLSEYGNDITLNQELFAKVKAVFDNQDVFNLNPEQKVLLEKKYKSFTRNGALLNETDKQTLRDIDKELGKTKLQFGENALAASNSFELWIENEMELDGLPASAKSAAKERAKSKGREDAWLITLDYPSYIPFMTYAKNRKKREELSLAFGSRAFGNNEYDNRQNILDIVNLRHKRAALLGYDSHASFVLEERMAKSPNTVVNFLEDLKSKSFTFAQKEFNELEEFAKNLDGIDELKGFDGAYYSEKLKQERFNFDEEKLKPYLSLEKCEQGMFELATKLFGLRFEVTTEVPVYHADVKTYYVYDSEDNFVSVFYTDYHPRPGKRQGAWMTSYKNQWQKEGENSRPHVSIVCNFTPPTQDTPSLLTFNELTTLFHEFGHALHGMCANTQYPSLSGTNVSWDFVELPSQMLENWCYEKDMLDGFARHYQTNEALPFDMVEKIKESASFMEGMKTVRQLSFGFLDMAYHQAPISKESKVEEIEKEVFDKVRLYPYNNKTCMSTAFSHIFNGGYSSGYYSYKWAEVLDADAFAYFKEKGIFNKEIADKFKSTVLEKGGTVEADMLYRSFRGKDADANALLKRAGLLK
jgi:peptidyl-dipeptidase Dcp